MNENVNTFTLGEVLDLLKALIPNENFVGPPGTGNLRDLGQLSKFGLKFVKHSGPN